MGDSVSVPRRAVAWSQPKRDSRQWIAAMFQCPEGLLLGRNDHPASAITMKLTSFSAPKGCCLVATGRTWAKASSPVCFSAPKGCCLVATTTSAAKQPIGIRVSVPRRAVAWSQRPQYRAALPRSHTFQCPEGLLLGRNIRPEHALHAAGGFQCPEGLLLGRNLIRSNPHVIKTTFQCPEGLLLGRNRTSPTRTQ